MNHSTKRLDITLEVQKPESENNTHLDFYITSGEILVTDTYKHFMPIVLVNGEEYSEYFLEDLRVVNDTRESWWPERLYFRLIWDKENKHRLKGIKAYYDFLLYRENHYNPDGGLSSEAAMKQKVHLELNER